MHERKTWENWQEEYQHRMKLTLAAMELLEMHLDKKSADSEVVKRDLLSANNKVRKLEALLKLESQKVNQLKIDYEEVKSKEKSKNNENFINFEGMKAQLASTVCGLKYVKNEAKNTDVKLSEAQKTIRAQEEKLHMSKLAQSVIERKINLELEQKEKLQGTISKLADEIVTLRREKHREKHDLEEAKAEVIKLCKDKKTLAQEIRELRRENEQLRRTLKLQPWKLPPQLSLSYHICHSYNDIGDIAELSLRLPSGKHCLGQPVDDNQFVNSCSNTMATVHDSDSHVLQSLGRLLSSYRSQKLESHSVEHIFKNQNQHTSCRSKSNFKQKAVGEKRVRPKVLKKKSAPKPKVISRAIMTNRRKKRV